MKFTKFLRTLFLENTSTLLAASGSKLWKPMKTLNIKVYAAEKEMINLNGTSKARVSS